jgi:hypothetical protein
MCSIVGRTPSAWTSAIGLINIVLPQIFFARKIANFPFFVEMGDVVRIAGGSSVH